MGTVINNYYKRANNMEGKYRPDIDGLRAVAVLAVVFFHASVPGFDSGYVGVDIFFVISGFLITGIIFREVNEDRFSIITFYERRFRRILPALFFMLIGTIIAGSVLLPPDSFNELGRSTFAAAAFISNILFFTDTGYFDAPAELKPLLHTWSLAVEEQFYIVLPLLLLALSKIGKRDKRSVAIVAISAISIASLFACIWVTTKIKAPHSI